MSEPNLYQPPTADLAPPVDSENLSVLADRGSRFVANLVDGLGYAALGIAAAIILSVTLTDRQEGTSTVGLVIVFGLLGVGFLGLFIWNLIWLHRHGQTIGKRVMNLRIVRTDGSRASLGRIFALRMLLPGVLGALPFFIGNLFALTNICFIFRADRRCLHDHMADTHVVKI